MLRTIFGRAFWLAFFLTIGASSSVGAHALPGSILTFSATDDGLGLAISLPLEDLVIAEGALSGILDYSFDTPLTDEDLSVLSRYFKDHLSVQQKQSELVYQVRHASLQQAYDDHIGNYSLMTLSLDIALETVPESLMLRYDAVMHEVRNHRAIVLWSTASTDSCMIVEFGYRPSNGTQQALPIARSAGQDCD